MRMNIERITISENSISKTYKFRKGMNLIHSKENSMGKTTMIRFLLYALGYQIPETEGIGSFSKYVTEIELEVKNRHILIQRQGNRVNMSEDGKSNEFILPLEEKNLWSKIFQINDSDVLKNLLGVFYIDQEKGWTMLNRGKVIGNIRFNIEEFIASLTNKDIYGLMEKKELISDRIKKYRLVSNLLEAVEEDTKEDGARDLFSEDFKMIQSRRNELLTKDRHLADKLRITQSAIKQNENFVGMIIDLGLTVIYNNIEIRVTRDNLSDFKINQDLLQKRRRFYEIERCKIKEELDLAQKKINQQNAMFTSESLIQSLESEISRFDIRIDSVNDIVDQLELKRRNINTQIKDNLSNNNFQLEQLFDTIRKYAVKLGVNKYVDIDDAKFVLTSKLKGLTGRVLAQLAFVFRLAYIKAVRVKYELCLPIIIDSPRAAELSEKSTSSMLKILSDDFSDHQIIMASIYKIEGRNEINEIELKNGFMDFLKQNELPLFSNVDM